MMPSRMSATAHARSLKRHAGAARRELDRVPLGIAALIERRRRGDLRHHVVRVMGGGPQAPSVTAIFGQYRRIVSENSPLAGVGSQFDCLSSPGDERWM